MEMGRAVCVAVVLFLALSGTVSAVDPSKKGGNTPQAGAPLQRLAEISSADDPKRHGVLHPQRLIGKVADPSAFPEPPLTGLLPSVPNKVLDAIDRRRAPPKPHPDLRVQQEQGELVEHIADEYYAPWSGYKPDKPKPLVTTQPLPVAPVLHRDESRPPFVVANTTGHSSDSSNNTNSSSGSSGSNSSSAHVGVNGSGDSATTGKGSNLSSSSTPAPSTGASNSESSKSGSGSGSSDGGVVGFFKDLFGMK